ncbi:pseudouridine synthase [Desulfovibrio cuneatus]|uniref:pseudouridine synthase n=1 Tax=Desulfovibrio cuneatus TaxID=159728 RepID=UPI0003F51EC2
MSEMRLNKALAEAGVCSRRKADELIAAGWVTVNGQVVQEMGLRVTPGKDAIAVQGQKVFFTPGQQDEKIYVLLHKPVQVVCTASDPQGRATVLDYLPQHLKNKRLYPVGRLDYFSEGLLLLTDDGELTHRLTHPRYHLPKEYEVQVREMPTQRMLETMHRGMTLAEGERLAPVEAHVAPDAPNTLHLVLHQGLNRQIRRMCRDLGLTILRLTRVSLGPISLGDLPSGKARVLYHDEIVTLRRAAGLGKR